MFKQRLRSLAFAPESSTMWRDLSRCVPAKVKAHVFACVTDLPLNMTDHLALKSYWHPYNQFLIIDSATHANISLVECVCE